MLRSTRLRGYLGSGLTDASSSIEMILLLLHVVARCCTLLHVVARCCTLLHVVARCCTLLPHQNASENTEKASELSSHSLSHTPTFSQPSRQPHRPLCARNSAFLSTPSAALLIGGYVLSCRRPGSDRGISAIINQTSRRKMFTFTRAIWLRRFQPTLCQDDPAQQPNQRGRGKRRGGRG